jgi:hypothetical protein
MPLPTPILDDRSYQQLRDELVRRIPVYNPDWTDHNPSDPGITLLELFAFLGENVLFRFNQIPEATRLAFLKLLQIPLRPPSPSRAIVVLKESAPGLPGPDPKIVPLGTELKAGAIPFRSGTEVSVAPWRFVGVAKLVAPAPTTLEAKDFTAAAVDALGGLKAGESAVYYRNGLVPEDPSKPDASILDFGASVDDTVWIAAVGERGFLADFARGESSVNVAFVPDETIGQGDPLPDPCPGDTGLLPRVNPCRPAESGPGASEVIWQISTGKLDGKGQPIYRALSVTGDTTNGLRKAGVVRLKIPRDAFTATGVFTLPDPDLAGTGDFPPDLEDEADRKATIFWLRAYPRSATAGEPQRRLGRVAFIGGNGLEVEQRRRAPPELLGSGNGQPGQSYRLVSRPVIPGSLVLEVEEAPGRWVRWREVLGFEASGEDDRVYALDLELGEVRFGNGLEGRPPQLGQRVRATEYHYGGGVAGNVAAKAISEVVSADGGPSFATLKATNPLPARGGSEVESIASAMERIPAELRRRDRAVTGGDFRELALATPGADVGRAECIPLYDPHTGNTRAAGVVTVVVFPREDKKHPSAPMPDQSTLRSVCAYLDRRRLVTTELDVIPPHYVPIAISIGVHVKPGYGVDAVRSWVELVVRQYLAPLPPYGPEGQGWPLGRQVIAPELAAAALQVEGVEYIEDGHVRVARKVGDTYVEGPVKLSPDQVPQVVAITVTQMKADGDAPLAPGAEFPSPPLPGKVVPIPTLSEEC